MEKFAIIARFDNGASAHIARTKLEASGIACFLDDENLVSINWLYSNTVGGIKLKVFESDAEDAMKILEQKEE